MGNAIRPAAVSGMFYPAQPQELTDMIDTFVGAAQVDVLPEPFAVIAPHAGYIYSGPIAGVAYAAASKRADSVKRVVLLGPSHHVALRGLAFPTADYFETPLGRVPVDLTELRPLLEWDFVEMRDDAHLREHSLEVQLPFMQKIFSEFTLYPFAVGQPDAEEVRLVLEKLCINAGRLRDDTIIVVSSDLSHYHPYGEACEIDRITSTFIERLELSELGPERACGAYAIRGLIDFSHKHDLKAKTLMLANSGDTAGGKDQVVGYGAYAFYKLSDS
ncbi:MAG: AmmeMemoRadiSam system protein B [Candidatus Dadabacteria bacterium]|nr:MAG: AmmeMemoRadiSam system protein B [Candidatus Dadabacteria bacterium]